MENCIKAVNINGPVTTTYFIKDDKIIAKMTLTINETQHIERWFYDGRLHRDGDQSAATCFENGQKTSKHGTNAANYIEMAIRL